MKKTFFASTTSTMIFFSINTMMNALFIYGAVSLFKGWDMYHFTEARMLLFLIPVIMLILNGHFMYLGMLNRITINHEGVYFRRVMSVERCISWEHVQDVNIVKEPRAYRGVMEATVIVISGYDRRKKEDVNIKITYKQEVYDMIQNSLKSVKKKAEQKMIKYFEQG